MMEDFKEIPGYEGIYSINVNGIVKRHDGKIMSQRKKREGVIKGRRQLPYISVSLTKRGIQKEFFVHTLILTTFRGSKPGKEFCAMHENDDPTDNRSGKVYGNSGPINFRCLQRQAINSRRI